MGKLFGLNALPEMVEILQMLRSLIKWAISILQALFNKELNIENTNIVSKGDQDIFLAKYHNCENNAKIILGDTFLCPKTLSIELMVKKKYKNIVWNDSLPGQYGINVDRPGMNHITAIDQNGCILWTLFEIRLVNDISFAWERSGITH